MSSHAHRKFRHRFLKAPGCGHCPRGISREQASHVFYICLCCTDATGNPEHKLRKCRDLQCALLSRGAALLQCVLLRSTRALRSRRRLLVASPSLTSGRVFTNTSSPKFSDPQLSARAFPHRLQWTFESRNLRAHESDEWSLQADQTIGSGSHRRCAREGESPPSPCLYTFFSFDRDLSSGVIGRCGVFSRAAVRITGFGTFFRRC